MRAHVERLPYYGVFDYIVFRVDRRTVTSPATARREAEGGCASDSSVWTQERAPIGEGLVDPYHRPIDPRLRLRCNRLVMVSPREADGANDVPLASTRSPTGAGDALTRSKARARGPGEREDL